MITLSAFLYKVTWSRNGVAGVCRESDTLMEVQYIYTKLDIYQCAINGQTENIIPCATNLLKLLSNFSSSYLFSPRKYHHTIHNQIAYM